MDFIAAMRERSTAWNYRLVDMQREIRSIDQNQIGDNQANEGYRIAKAVVESTQETRQQAMRHREVQESAQEENLEVGTGR